MVAHNQEVDEVNHQHTEDNGKLVTRYQCSTNIRGCNFCDVHRTYGRGKTYTDTAQYAIQIECDEQFHVWLTVVEE